VRSGRRPRGCTLSVLDPPHRDAAPSVVARGAGPVGLPRWGILTLLALAQVGLALAMLVVPVLGLAQGAGLLLLGLYAIARRNPTMLTCVCAYLVGCEVLWRQVRAPSYYLMAPYTLIILSGLALLLLVGRIGKDARLALLFVALLLPSMVNTVRVAGGGSRELIAFALSGPIALAAFVAFTSQMRATREAYRRILWAVTLSAIGPLTIAVTTIRLVLADHGSIAFSTQSNSITSGGFGPVQVSAVLGVGVLTAILLTMLEKDRSVRIVAALLGTAFAVQSLLTFSRGGMAATAIAVGALAVSQARNRRIRNRLIAVVALALAIGYFVVIPWLVDFTGGAFEDRFTDTSSGRTELAANDFEIFERNPIFGVGPGMTKFQRLTYEICQLRSDQCREEASSHTELTRLLGEHGVPGIAAAIVLGVLAFRALRRARTHQPFAVAFIFWTVAQMFYANLRVVAVPFAFGLAFLTIEDDPPPPVGDEPDDLGPTRAAAEPADTDPTSR
jgi:O-Antigen ligase